MMINNGNNNHNSSSLSTVLFNNNTEDYYYSYNNDANETDAAAVLVDAAGGGDQEVSLPASDVVAPSDEVFLWLTWRDILISQAICWLSILGSYIVLREVAADHHHRSGGQGGSGSGRGPSARVLVGLSLADIVFTLPQAFSTYAIPKQVNFVAGTYGNTTTCHIQAFFYQWGLVATPLYNAALVLVSLVVVRYNWNDSKLKSFEFAFHALIWLLSLGCAVFPLVLDIYGNATKVCWFDQDNPQAQFWTIFFGFFPSWPAIIVSAIAMALVYKTVSDIEKRNHTRYLESMELSNPIGRSNNTTTRRSLVDVDGDLAGDVTTMATAATPTTPTRSSNTYNNRNHRNISIHNMDSYHQHYKRSRAVRNKALFYMTAFIATWMAFSIMQIHYYVFRKFSLPFLKLAHIILMPMQGLWTGLVFAFGRTMKTPEGKIFKKIADAIGRCIVSIARCLCCCLSSSSQQQRQQPSTRRGRTQQHQHQRQKKDHYGRRVKDASSSSSDNNNKPSSSEPPQQSPLRLAVVSSLADDTTTQQQEEEERLQQQPQPPTEFEEEDNNDDSEVHPAPPSQQQQQQRDAMDRQPCRTKYRNDTREDHSIHRNKIVMHSN